MRRHRWSAFGALAAATVLLACNAIIGAPDRYLDEEEPLEDGGPNPREDRDVPTAEDGDVPPVDGGPTTIDIPIADVDWSSPNQGVSGFDGGVVIAQFEPPNNHPMLVPVPAPPVPTDKYTLRARIFAPEQKEYGIFVRGRQTAEGFSAFVLSSRYSAPDGGVPPSNKPFLASLTTARADKSSDDPSSSGVADAKRYPFESGRVWIFEIDVDGDRLQGTITREDAPSIGSTMPFIDPTPPAERGSVFGFYGFRKPGAALLQLQLIY